MGTKERKTPVQDTLSGARFNLPDPKSWRPTPRNGGENRIRKPEIDFQGGPQKISDQIFPQLILDCAS
jgi:hypothetical protein